MLKWVVLPPRIHFLEALAKRKISFSNFNEVNNWAHIVLLKNIFKKDNLPIKTAHSEIINVRAKARTGSPFADTVSNGFKNGMIWSFAIAWSNLGAPVRDCNPAPMVDSRDPISTTLGWGQAMLPTTKEPPIASPNLQKLRNIFFKIVKGAKPTSTSVPWHWLFLPRLEYLPRNYDTLKSIAKKPWSLEVALVDFSPLKG